MDFRQGEPSLPWESLQKRYMQARFYVPWFGRFASPDPARDQHFRDTQSWNIYSYVRNNPVMSVDPTGMLTEDEKNHTNVNGGKVSPNAARGETTNNTVALKNQQTKTWSDKLVLVLDAKYKDKTPEFVQKQVDALKLTASAADHDLTVTFHYVQGLNERLASANGTNESEKSALSFKNEMVSIGKSYGAQSVASILPPIPWARMNGGSLDGEGFTQKHYASGINIMMTSNNSRALAHEYLHALGYSKGKWENTPPFNYFHNRRFDRMMDAAGVPAASYPKDY